MKPKSLGSESLQLLGHGATAFVTTLMALSGWGLAALTPFMQNFARDHSLNLLSERTRTAGDWRVIDQVFRAPSGKLTFNWVIPKLGGQETTAQYLNYAFVSPRDNDVAVRMLKDFSLDDDVEQLSADDLESCLSYVRRIKAPQVKTMLWRREGSTQTKVYCGVTAVTEYVVFDRRDLGSAYWKLKSGW